MTTSTPVHEQQPQPHAASAASAAASAGPMSGPMKQLKQQLQRDDSVDGTLSPISSKSTDTEAEFLKKKVLVQKNFLFY